MKQRGVSLVEALLVVVTIGSVVFLLANLPNALGLITKSKHLSLAREIVAKQIEDKRNISYSNLVVGSSTVSDSRLSLLPQGTGTVDVTDCDLYVCTNGEHVKQVKVEVTWKENQKTQKVSLQTMIGEGGINQ